MIHHQETLGRGPPTQKWANDFCQLASANFTASSLSTKQDGEDDENDDDDNDDNNSDSDDDDDDDNDYNNSNSDDDDDNDDKDNIQKWALVRDRARRSPRRVLIRPRRKQIPSSATDDRRERPLALCAWAAAPSQETTSKVSIAASLTRRFLGRNHRWTSSSSVLGIAIIAPAEENAR
ncbi:hypothetical protein CDD80_4700 [Ophiocordyceps camponoti-rufipedis]|uniref:Uncharacterized protein n=1 Tax=Ophiocordyceps camponoti-rufipedis TaxID=2004952 RepID=A0A2C5ZHX9_9HYPO|nr:hypothetical protein CDD80_4700 [Ophiocordyceps camponoti-rufipedis]